MKKRVSVAIEFDADSVSEAVARINAFQTSFGANCELLKAEIKEAKP